MSDVGNRGFRVLDDQLTGIVAPAGTHPICASVRRDSRVLRQLPLRRFRARHEAQASASPRFQQMIARIRRWRPVQRGRFEAR